MTTETAADPIGNLRYATDDVRRFVTDKLASPGCHWAVRDIVLDGLNRDCLDAARDAQDAAALLEMVRISIEKRPLTVG